LSHAETHPDYQLKSETQARAWVQELLEGQEKDRQACEAARTVGGATQRKAYTALMVKHGALLGTIVALHRCGLLTDQGYNELRAKAVAVLDGGTGR